jgi:hypothetical protein
MGAHVRWVIGVVFVSSLLPRPAAAQPAQPTSGPMTVERLHSGFMVAPDFKATIFDKKVSPLAGGYAGWVTDDTIFIGGAGYWLTNGSRDRRLAYGGLMVQWLTKTEGPVGFSLKGLIGGGQSTLTTSVTEIAYPLNGPPFGDYYPDPRAPMPLPVPSQITTNVRFSQDFFVAEPEADVLFHLGRGVRLTAGVGYRAVSVDHGGDGSRIRGATGSIALQIGGR